MADTSDIDAALVAKLGSDATLLSLAPNGVYFDLSPAGSTKFVIVSLVEGIDEGQFGGTAYEEKLYAIEYRELKPATGAGNAKAAAARIHQLLQDQPLTVAGYTWMACYRESPIRNTEPDALDTSIMWNRRGGQYRVQMSIT